MDFDKKKVFQSSEWKWRQRKGTPTPPAIRRRTITKASKCFSGRLVFHWKPKTRKETKKKLAKVPTMPWVSELTAGTAATRQRRAPVKRTTVHATATIRTGTRRTESAPNFHMMSPLVSFSLLLLLLLLLLLRFDDTDGIFCAADRRLGSSVGKLWRRSFRQQQRRQRRQRRRRRRRGSPSVGDWTAVGDRLALLSVRCFSYHRPALLARIRPPVPSRVCPGPGSLPFWFGSGTRCRPGSVPGQARSASAPSSVGVFTRCRTGLASGVIRFFSVLIAMDRFYLFLPGFTRWWTNFAPYRS